MLSTVELMTTFVFKVFMLAGGGKNGERNTRKTKEDEYTIQKEKKLIRKL